MLHDKLGLEKKALKIAEESAQLSKEEQLRFVEDACGDNKNLLGCCHALLDHQVSDEAFMELVYGKPAEQKVPADEVGSVIGNYKLGEKIGQGGMADVYFAIRNDDVHDQPVAFKIIRGWGNVQELIDRMKRERKILSQLKHPNIAGFIDGGNADDHRPYFVLEYIEGKPINEYCQEKSLTVKERLELFIVVCSAVYAAHTKLILHRDLKPNNILVTEEGIPKLLDFGIAKILDEEDADPTQLTFLGSPMTPQYASPEQVKQEPLSVASDQYSLGVLLYELITDHMPYQVSSGNLYRAICEETAVLPSYRIAKQMDKGANERIRLVKKIRGDLDAIVIKAIQKQPDQRYASVNEFADDIRRYLQKKTVLAQKSTIWYRLTQFVNRNLTIVVMSTSFILVLLIVGITQQIRIISERDQAILEKNKFEQTQEYLVGLFELANPSQNRSENIPVRELLDRGVETIENKFADQPKVKYSLLLTMGRIYFSLGLYSKSVELLNASLALQEENGQDPDETRAITLRVLVQGLAKIGDLTEASRLSNEMLDIYDSIKVKDPKEYANAYSAAAFVHFSLGEYSDAVVFFKKSLEIREGNLPESDSDVSKSYAQVAVALALHDEIDQALKYNEKALQLKNKYPDQEQATTMYIYYNIGDLYKLKGEDEKAMEYFVKSIPFAREYLGESHPDNTRPLLSIGMIYNEKGEYDKAIENINKAIAILEVNNNDAVEYVIQAKAILSEALAGVNNKQAAIEQANTAIEMSREVFGEQHPIVAFAYAALGNVHAVLKETENAENYYNKALAINLKVYGATHHATKEIEDRLLALHSDD